MEYLDPMASRAFAVADHDQLLDDEGKKAHHLDHPRSGELVAVAEPDAWFTYYYWLADARAPDFAALPHGGRAPGPFAYSRQPRPPAHERRRRSAHHLLLPPRCR